MSGSLRWTASVAADAGPQAIPTASVTSQRLMEVPDDAHMRSDPMDLQLCSRALAQFGIYR